MKSTKKNAEEIDRDARLMQLEIEEKRRLPETIKQKAITSIFHSLLGAIIVLAYLVSIDIMFKYCELQVFENNMKYVALGIIIVTVLVFETAYQKDSMKLMSIGIELLACAIVSLYIPYIYMYTSSLLKIAIMVLPAWLVIYYLIKSFVIYKAHAMKHLNNLSDVKEILKKEEPNYINEQSKKSYRKKVEDEKILKQEIAEEQLLRKRKKELEKAKTENEAKRKNKKKKHKKEVK